MSSTSSPSSLMLPDQRVRCSGCSRRIERRVTLLPEPDSPRMPSVSPRLHVEADAVHRVHGAVGVDEGDVEVAGPREDRSCQRRRLRMAGAADAHVAGDRLRGRSRPAAARPWRRHPRRTGSACGSGSPTADRSGWADRPGSAPPWCACADPSTAAPTAAPACRDAAGRRRSPRPAPISTILPRYITSTRSLRYCTTLRSWLMKR